MAYSDLAVYDTVRSETVFGAAYTALGTAFTDRPVLLCFKNATDGDVVVSDDGVNDKLVFPAGSYTVYDIRTNAPTDTDLTFSKRVQFYVKDGSTPSTTGTFYLEAVIVRVLP